MFILIPILEISVIIQVGTFLGVMPTLAIMVVSALIGASLVRSQGIATLMSLRKKMDQGEMPSREIMEGLILLVAGVLLMTPGFVTDIVGMLILTAPVRRLVAETLLKRFILQMVNVQPMQGATFYTHSENYRYTTGTVRTDSPQQSSRDDALLRRGEVIDGEFERKD
jgi:UPF0716 protein FxsA